MLTDDTAESFERVIRQYMPTFTKNNTTLGTRYTYLTCYAQTTSEILLAKIRKAAYRQESAYIKIDYDAPLPTLKGKK
jgi:hypothetical protein